MIETLKTLNKIDIPTMKVESEREIVGLLTRIAAVKNDEQGRLAFQALNDLLKIDPNNVNAEWVREFRPYCLNVCHSPRPHPVAFQALRFLAGTAEKEDVKHVAYLVLHWPEDLYSITKPSAWVKVLGQQFGREVEHGLRALIAPGVTPQIQARAQELLAILRKLALT